MRHEYPFSSIVPSSWAVVNTQPHRERTALENLARQDFHAYCPMVRKRIRHARRAQDALRPLFPGYVFVRVDPDLRRWRPILSTIGVRTVVCCGAQPSLVDDGFVRSLQAREIEGVVTRPVILLQIGQEVRISGGPFDGLVATIIEMDEKERLVVLMDLLRRPTKVRIEAQSVMPAGC